jgi:hypothetical protein
MMASGPCITGIARILSSHSDASKVERGTQETGSVPTVALISPSAAAISPVVSDAPTRL